MCLRFVFLLITRVAAWLRLSRREDVWKTAEILILRQQVAVLQRRQSCRLKLNWADRALIAALLGLIPKVRRQGLGLLVTPDTIALALRHRPPPLGLYRFRTRCIGCDLRFGRITMLGQDGGLCLFACST
jgi:hypothetical protein